jgi:hypothetical protein
MHPTGGRLVLLLLHERLKIAAAVPGCPYNAMPGRRPVLAQTTNQAPACIATYKEKQHVIKCVCVCWHAGESPYTPSNTQLIQHMQQRSPRSHPAMRPTQVP